MKLAILMAVHNEAATLHEAVTRALAVAYPVDTELVIVDDGSTDSSPGILREFEHDPRVVVHTQPNRGKGAAIRAAAERAHADYCVMYDADLEYLPEDIPRLVDVVLQGEATVVYGSRTFGSHNSYSLWYVLGNKLVTMTANVLFNAYISDLETCFKLMPLQLFRDLDLRSEGFGIEAEITAKLLARGVRVFEVPITYRARTREEGKKLTWRDGVEAVWILLRVRSTRGGIRRRAGFAVPAPPP